MDRSHAREVPAKTRAVLVDPVTMTVLWMNEAAGTAAASRGADPATGASVEQAVPMVEGLGVAEALRAVAETGVSRYLTADLLSRAHGSVLLVIAVHRLPSGELLVLEENTYAVKRPSRSRTERG